MPWMFAVILKDIAAGIIAVLPWSFVRDVDKASPIARMKNL
jgi:hypothetical protein